MNMNFTERDLSETEVQNEKICDADRLFLIYYLDVSGMSEERGKHRVAQVFNLLTNSFDDSVKIIVVPNKSVTKVEFFHKGILKPIERENIDTMIMEKISEVDSNQN